MTGIGVSRMGSSDNVALRYLQERTLWNSFNGRNLSALVTEGFTGKDFSNLVSALENFASKLPASGMPNIKKALKRSINSAFAARRSLAKKQITSEDFAKTIAEIDSLIKAISNSLEEIEQIQKLRTIYSKVQEAVEDQEKTIKEM